MTTNFEYIRFISPQLSNNKRFVAYTLYNVRDSGPVLLVSFYVSQCGLLWSGYNSAGWVGAVSFMRKYLESRIFYLTGELGLCVITSLCALCCILYICENVSH